MRETVTNIHDKDKFDNPALEYARILQNGAKDWIELNNIVRSIV